jgi:hypothetical protein
VRRSLPAAVILVVPFASFILWVAAVVLGQN